jgi:hypothetical protein
VCSHIGKKDMPVTENNIFSFEGFQPVSELNFFCVRLGRCLATGLYATVRWEAISTRVEAGKNTSTVIPASRKRRQSGNPVVSDEILMYGYESPATLTTDRLHCKLQTRPLVREGTPRRRAKQLSGKRREKVKSGHGLQRGARH